MSKLILVLFVALMTGCASKIDRVEEKCQRQARSGDVGEVQQRIYARCWFNHGGAI